MEDDGGLPQFARAGQNIAAAAALVRGLPAPTTPEEQRIQRGIRELLGRAAEQQAESSRSWRRGPGNGQPASTDRETGDTSVHQAPRGALTANLPPLQERVGPIRDARVILDARQRAKDDRRREAGVGYHPRRGGRFDVNEDRSPSPPPPGPQAFGRHILRAPFPQRYRAPTNMLKYSRESNPGLWLEDYRLTCQAGGADNDNFIIRNLPLYLADSARTWLEHLPPNSIQDWTDLREIFVGNFQGTYARPGNPWDLKNCQQKTDESLRDYIRRFSRQCNQLPNVADADVISAFLSGTTNRTLVHKLGQRSPRTTKELLDIATSHASGEDAVGAIFDRSKGKAKQDEDANEGTSNRSVKKKKNQRRREGLLVATADRKGKRVPAKDTPDHFEKMLEAPCPNHGYPVKHALKDCGLMKKFLAGSPKKWDRRKPDPKDGDAEGDGVTFPVETACLMIFGGPDSFVRDDFEPVERLSATITTAVTTAVPVAIPAIVATVVAIVAVPIIIAVITIVFVLARLFFLFSRGSLPPSAHLAGFFLPGLCGRLRLLLLLLLLCPLSEGPLLLLPSRILGEGRVGLGGKAHPSLRSAEPGVRR